MDGRLATCFESGLQLSRLKKIRQKRQLKFHAGSRHYSTNSAAHWNGIDALIFPHILECKYDDGTVLFANGWRNHTIPSRISFTAKCQIFRRFELCKYFCDVNTNYRDLSNTFVCLKLLVRFHIMYYRRAFTYNTSWCYAICAKKKKSL